MTQPFLRTLKENLRDPEWVKYWFDQAGSQAANEIERLEAELAADRTPDPAVAELVEALEKLLLCPSIADGNHTEPAWECKETKEAETFARAALAKHRGK